MTADFARDLLDLIDVTFDDDDIGGTTGRVVLNMNDTFAWALAWGEEVPLEALPEVGRLFVAYGMAGLYYWVSERNKQCKSEFHDVQRAIEFVRHEEEIRALVPDSNKRAYHEAVYTLGGK